MAKISTLTGTFVVLWLAMLAGTWAGRPPTEEELGAWVNVLRGAEAALQADKLQTAMAMIAGVAARLEATDLPDDEKGAKFLELLKAIEHAVEKDNKAKAIALMNTLQSEFERRHGDARPGATPQRQLGEQDPHPHIKPPHEANLDLAAAKDLIKIRLKEALKAITQHEMGRAEDILNTLYLFIKDNEQLCPKQKEILVFHAIHKTQKYIQEDAREKAEKALEEAANMLGVSYAHSEGA